MNKDKKDKILHENIFGDVFKEHWLSDKDNAPKMSEDDRVKASEKELSEVIGDGDGEHILGIVYECMNRYHAKMDEFGDIESQLLNLGSYAVGLHFENNKLKKEIAELKEEIESLAQDVQMAKNRYKSGLQIGSYNSKHKTK